MRLEIFSMASVDHSLAALRNQTRQNAHHHRTKATSQKMNSKAAAMHVRFAVGFSSSASPEIRGEK